MGGIGMCVFVCDVLTVCRQHKDEEWKFKEQHANMWENIAGAKRYSRPRGFNIAGASAPVAPALPTPLLRTTRTGLNWRNYYALALRQRRH